MNCPYQEKEVLPCAIVQHPSEEKEDIYFCRICQQCYDVRDIGTEPESNSSFIAIILGIIFVIVGIGITSQPSPPTPNTIEGSSLNNR